MTNYLYLLDFIIYEVDIFREHVKIYNKKISFYLWPMSERLLYMLRSGRGNTEVT